MPGVRNQYLSMWGQATPPFNFTISTPTSIGMYFIPSVSGRLVGVSAWLPAQGSAFQSYGFIAKDGQSTIVNYFGFYGYQKNVSHAGWTSTFLHPMRRITAGDRWVVAVTYFQGSSTQVKCMLNGTGSGGNRTAGTFTIPASTGSVPNGGTQTTRAPFLPGSMGGFIPALDVLILP